MDPSQLQKTIYQICQTNPDDVLSAIEQQTNIKPQESNSTILYRKIDPTEWLLLEKLMSASSGSVAKVYGYDKKSQFYFYERVEGVLMKEFFDTCSQKQFLVLLLRLLVILCTHSMNFKVMKYDLHFSDFKVIQVKDYPVFGYTDLPVFYRLEHLIEPKTDNEMLTILINFLGGLRNEYSPDTWVYGILDPMVESARKIGTYKGTHDFFVNGLTKLIEEAK